MQHAKLQQEFLPKDPPRNPHACAYRCQAICKFWSDNVEDFIVLIRNRFAKNHLVVSVFSQLGNLKVWETCLIVNLHPLT